MKTPPLLLGATLLFWGWQTGFLPASAVMAAVLEGARFTKVRWDFSDEDFSRIWTFCTLVFLAAAVYAFTDNAGPAQFSNLFHNPTVPNQSRAGTASARTAAAMLRWLPMVLFFFVAAQAYSSRDRIPLTTISLLLRLSRKRMAKLRQPLPATRGVNVTYPYFAVCLFAASVHSSEDDTYFWGLCVLLAWALWSQRPRRVAAVVWVSVFALAVLLGYGAQRGIGQLQSLIQNLDSRLLAALVHRNTDPTQNRTSIDDVSQTKMSGKIVIRLKPRPGSRAPEYLHEATYRVFASPNWLASTHKAGFQVFLPETNGTTWILLPTAVSSNTVQISCYLEERSRESGNPTGLLPLPTGCSRLEKLPAFGLRYYSAGALLAEGPGLVTFDALYGPGASLASLPTNEDLSVPPGDQPVLDTVIAQHDLANRNRDDTLRAVSGYFRNGFAYRLSSDPLDRVRTNETSLEHFLLTSRSGHCEYFATATVLLLRRLHIEARYAVGYAVHEAAGSGYVVRLRDAHAWCMVWNPQTKSWDDFDTTPASWIEAEAQNASGMQWLSDAWSWIRFQFSRFRWGQTHLRQYILVALLPVLGYLLFQVFRRNRRRKTDRSRAVAPALTWPGLDSEFYLVERRLAERGVTRRLNEPLSEWLQRAIAESALADMRQPLTDLLRLHYRWRFDPSGLNATDREQLKRGAQSVLAGLEKNRG